MNWQELRNMRAAYPDNDYMQGILAPMEHRQYARETVRDDPMSAFGLAIGIPGYYAAKKMGLLEARTPADVDQMFQGYRGIHQGLTDAAADVMSDVAKKLNPWIPIGLLYNEKQKPKPVTMPDAAIRRDVENIRKRRGAGKRYGS